MPTSSPRQGRYAEMFETWSRQHDTDGHDPGGRDPGGHDPGGHDPSLVPQATSISLEPLLPVPSGRVTGWGRYPGGAGTRVGQRSAGRYRDGAGTRAGQPGAGPVPELRLNAARLP